nr:2-dehydro-3-deoxy-6-phosphogalactonate aldolase [uncultured Albidiferax sp.]
MHAPHPPLVAILRGLDIASAEDVGRALFDAGFRILEVPLNRPGALECIRRLSAMAPADALVGAGTVLRTADVDAVKAAGGKLIVSPNCNPAVISHSAASGLYSAPGIATPSEAFAALEAGAHALKIFPAEQMGTAGLKALLSVLPSGTPIWPVGGITPESMAAWVKVGATGFGIGGQLYAPGTPADQVKTRAAGFMAAWKACQPG